MGKWRPSWVSSRHSLRRKPILPRPRHRSHWKTVLQCERCLGRGRIGLRLSEWRLETQLGRHLPILTDVVVHTIPGADYGLLPRLPGQAHARSKVVLVRMYQPGGILLARNRPGLSRLHRRHRAEIRGHIKIHLLIVEFAERRHVFIA